jgi:hypothetical protein
LRNAAAQYMKEVFGVTADPETEIVHSIGSKAALSILPAALIDPGDVVHAQRTAVTDTANTGAWSPSIGPQDQLVRCAPCETPDEGSRHALVDRS